MVVELETWLYKRKIDRGLKEQYVVLGDFFLIWGQDSSFTELKKNKNMPEQTKLPTLFSWLN